MIAVIIRKNFFWERRRYECAVQKILSVLYLYTEETA